MDDPNETLHDNTYEKKYYTYPLAYIIMESKDQKIYKEVFKQFEEITGRHGIQKTNSQFIHY